MLSLPLDILGEISGYLTDEELVLLRNVSSVLARNIELPRPVRLSYSFILQSTAMLNWAVEKGGLRVTSALTDLAIKRDNVRLLTELVKTHGIKLEQKHCEEVVLMKKIRILPRMLDGSLMQVTLEMMPSLYLRARRNFYIISMLRAHR